jgi:hypothetical protein
MFIVVEARIDVRLSKLETRASSIELRDSIRASSPRNENPFRTRLTLLKLVSILDYRSWMLDCFWVRVMKPVWFNVKGERLVFWPTDVTHRRNWHLYLNP